MDKKQWKEQFEGVTHELEAIWAERASTGQTARSQREKELLAELDLMEYEAGPNYVRDGD